jgi:hypothetical protein
MISTAEFLFAAGAEVGAPKGSKFLGADAATGLVVANGSAAWAGARLGANGSKLLAAGLGGAGELLKASKVDGAATGLAGLLNASNDDVVAAGFAGLVNGSKAAEEGCAGAANASKAATGFVSAGAAKASKPLEAAGFDFAGFGAKGSIALAGAEVLSAKGSKSWEAEAGAAAGLRAGASSALR